MKRNLLFVVTLLLSACASAPKPVGGPIEGSPGVGAAVAQPEKVKGARVRWGGTIVSVENQADATLVEVVSRELDEEGEPSGEGSSGRFLARVPGFLDPEVYKRGRRFTVSGTVGDPVTRSIGSYPYRYPVVLVERHFLWEREPTTVYIPNRPYFFDPYWDPWYFTRRPWPYGPYW